MSVLHPAAGAAVLGTKTVDLLALAGLRRPCPRCEPVSFVALLCLAPKLQAPRGSLRTPPKRCARLPGRSRPRQFPPKAGRSRPKGWRVLALGVGLSLGPRWIRPLLNVSLPFGLGFFHEVGAKLLVEIGPEGGHRHNSPLMIPPSSEGVTAEGPLGDETGPLPSLSKLL
jgi:hypothetical protein